MNGGVLSSQHMQESRVCMALVLYRHLVTTLASVELAPICILVLKVELLPIAH